MYGDYAVRTKKKGGSSTHLVSAKVRTKGKGLSFSQTGADKKVFKVPVPATMRSARRNTKTK